MKPNLLCTIALLATILLAFGSIDSSSVPPDSEKNDSNLTTGIDFKPTTNTDSQSTSPTDSQSTSKSTNKATPSRPRTTAKLIVEDWRLSRKFGAITAAGEVTNNTGSSLKNVVVVATFSTADGSFVKTSEALISYNPILAGQTSPFEVGDTDNPAIKGVKIGFKKILGGSISYTTRKELNKPTPEEIEAARKAQEAERKAQEEAARAVEEKEKQRLARIEAAKWKTWTTADGDYSIRAKFLKMANGKLTLEKEDGTSLDVQFKLLREEDQDFVLKRKWTKAGKEK